MRYMVLVAVLIASLAVGWLIGIASPWWVTAIVVVGALGYVRYRLSRGRS